MKIPATGKNVFIHGMSILHFEKEKIIRGQVMWDMSGVLRQIGLLPEISH
jgi:predicted ester cyclase